VMCVRDEEWPLTGPTERWKGKHPSHRKENIDPRQCASRQKRRRAAPIRESRLLKWRLRNADKSLVIGS
jgi:hypothetical protein